MSWRFSSTGYSGAWLVIFVSRFRNRGWERVVSLRQAILAERGRRPSAKLRLWWRPVLARAAPCHDAARMVRDARRPVHLLRQSDRYAAGRGTRPGRIARFRVLRGERWMEVLKGTPRSCWPCQDG